MHQALQIEEILFNIFDHCRLPDTGVPSSDLTALARTCRAFKEPSLDVLWEELLDPSPVAQCLPEAHQASPDKCYSFCRPITQIEWGILRSYTRRIRSILDEDDAFDWESVVIFLDPPTTEPLFPNLRHLRATRSTGIKHLLRMPFPSLLSLRVWLISQDGNPHAFQAPLVSISRFSPDIKTLSVGLRHGNILFSNFFSGYVCLWQNLHTVECPSIALDIDALAHLSRTPAMVHLTFKLSTPLPSQISLYDSPLFFSNLLTLKLYSDFLDPISRLLSRIRLSVVTDFNASVESCPSRQDFSSFLASVQMSGICRTVRTLWLTQMLSMPYDPAPVLHPVLGFEDLEPCMSFSDLRRIEVNIDWTVDLTDHKLLALVSAWPHLEYLAINKEWGWNTPGGITPNGLLQLLQTCPSLSCISLAIDTRDYTEFHPSPVSLALVSRPKFHIVIDVVDSIIEAESVLPVAAFFAGIAPRGNFTLRSWSGFAMDVGVYNYRWFDVHRLALEAAGVLFWVRRFFESRDTTFDSRRLNTEQDCRVAG